MIDGGAMVDMDYKKRISEYYAGEHKKSQQKIKYGIVCIIAIPLIFLMLMFTMKSSKLIYLVLWIAALFIISAYLISVEYRDYMLQKQLNEFIGENEAQPLIEFPNIINLVQLEGNQLSEQDGEILEEKSQLLEQNDKILKESNQILKQKNNKSEKKQKKEKIDTIQDKEWSKIQREDEKAFQNNRTNDLEKEIQMLQEIARLRTQLGMGDYSSLYKDNDNMGK